MEFNKDLIKKYTAKIDNIAKKVVADNITLNLNDLKLDLLFTLYKCAKNFDEDKKIKFNTYLSTALSRAVSRHIRNNCYISKRPKIFIEDKQLEDNNDRGLFDYTYLSMMSNIEEKLDAQFLIKWILKQRSRFNQKDFNIFVDYYLNQLTKEELVDKYKLARESINIRIRKVKAKLKELMKANEQGIL